MAAENYNLTFSKEMADRPILYNLGKRFDVVVTLKRAQVSESAGWIQITLSGDPDEIQRAAGDLMTQGIIVSPLHLRPLGGSDVNPMP